MTDDEKRELIAEARGRSTAHARQNPEGSVDLARRLADALEGTLTEPEWQYSYVEKWADGSGVYERVTFKTIEEASRWATGNVASISGYNSEILDPEDHLVASIERRRVVTPGEWEEVPDV